LKWFNLAEAWNAVLLVDEADIFLDRRQNRDLARNGLVSGKMLITSSTCPQILTITTQPSSGEWSTSKVSSS
jgi:hypothetical protein